MTWITYIEYLQTTTTNKTTIYMYIVILLNTTGIIHCKREYKNKKT